MPKMTHQTKAQKREVRAIQRFIRQYGYLGWFTFKLHNTGYFTSDGYAVGLCAKGVVLSYGGGATIEDWTDYKAGILRKFLNGAIKEREANEKNEKPQSLQ